MRRMASDPNSDFRKRLREFRASLDITQEQMAERAGLNYKHYQEIERGGKTEVRFSTLVKISRALGIPLYQLFTEEPADAILAETASSAVSYGEKRKRKPAQGG
jgi:transcriptional regulator with XRE-family HTH domain